jgi:RNA polymerase sigma-70 factor (ECF subfamily)
MIRLRLDRRLRGKVRSADVLALVFREFVRCLDEYLANPSQSVFLWLRSLAGTQLQQLHEQFLDHPSEMDLEISLYRGALPEVNSVALAAQLMGPLAGQGSETSRTEAQIRLQDALNSMEPLDREILALCHFEELSNAEAAAVLNLDRAAASQRYIRALKRLKEVLSNMSGFFGKR